MSTFPTISFKKFIHVLEQLGFQKTRQRGSHIRFVHQDGRKTTVPDHGNRDVPKGLLTKIIRHDLDMELEEFFKFLQ
jgi:predicted RNA binding protein YcfA (HicA-like mRNA interferase family)